jgi:hypothetical protein
MAEIASPSSVRGADYLAAEQLFCKPANNIKENKQICTTMILASIVTIALVLEHRKNKHKYQRVCNS